jgi:hypothetical protein
VPTNEEFAELRRRVADLEGQIALLCQAMKANPPAGARRCWRDQVGAFANDPLYEETNRLGRDWRESQR